MMTAFYIYRSCLDNSRLCVLPNLYHCSKKLKSSLYRLAYSGEPLQNAVMCSVTWVPLDVCPHPWLSCHPPLLHSHVAGTRAQAFLWWFPALLWALVRSCAITKGGWPVKEEEAWAILVMTPEPTLDTAEWVPVMGLPHRPGEDLARAKYRLSITWWWL